jgi:hypothetical protein
VCVKIALGNRQLVGFGVWTADPVPGPVASEYWVEHTLAINVILSHGGAWAPGQYGCSGGAYTYGVWGSDVW